MGLMRRAMTMGQMNPNGIGMGDPSGGPGRDFGLGSMGNPRAMRPDGIQPQMPPTSTPPINPQQQPAMGGMGGGLSPQMMQAFQMNPQFQQQLQAMMQGQSPGFQQPQFTPPPQAAGGFGRIG